MSKRVKICLTGGPSAGKTTVVDILSRELSTYATSVPEAASIIYKGGFPRNDDFDSIKAAQKSIYYLQVEMERMIEKRSSKKVILCDRGTLDGPGYWPKDGSSFYDAVGSSIQAEIPRYDLVIHLQTVDRSVDYLGTPVRQESPLEALKVDKDILQSWEPHPRRIVVPSKLSFQDKVGAVLQSIELWLHKQEHIDRNVPVHLQSLRASLASL